MKKILRFALVAFALAAMLTFSASAAEKNTNSVVTPKAAKQTASRDQVIQALTAQSKQLQLIIAFENAMNPNPSPIAAVKSYGSGLPAVSFARTSAASFAERIRRELSKENPLYTPRYDFGERNLADNFAMNSPFCATNPADCATSDADPKRRAKYMRAVADNQPFYLPPNLSFTSYSYPHRFQREG